jgi:hypothetical protein
MYFLSPRRKAAIAAAAFCLVLPLAHAADVNARIRGTVTDPTGAVIPKVTVIATNKDTGVKYTAVTNASGEYLFPQLPVGTYTIAANPAGFKGFSASGIVLNIDQEYVEPIALTTGSASDTVMVEADAVQVNTTDMQISNIVNSAQMEELPLIGRGFTGLELIEPGVQSSSDRFGTYSVSGAQTQQSSFLINGADINDIALNTPVVSPNLDLIDQFNLIEGPLNAEYDRNSGGIVSATIKQGTNRIHGDLFEFYRDTFLNTPNFFAYQSSTHSKTITPYHQNIFGGYVTGPIIKDKFFGSFGYSGTHQRVPGSGGSTTVYSTAELAGNFSDDFGAKGGNLGYKFSGKHIPNSITIPGCVSGSAGDTWSACATKLNGIFPTTAFNPIAAKLLKTYVPAANSGANTYNFPSVSATTTNQYLGRLDYTLNPKNTFTFVGLYQSSATNGTIPFTGASLPGFGEVDASYVNQYTLDYVRQFSSSLVNDASAHITRFNYKAVFPASTVLPSSLGFNITPQYTAGASVPTISTGYFTLGFSTNGPQPRIDTNYQIDENLSYIVGHHNFKVGYDGRKFQVSNPFNANNSGSFGFSQGGTYSSGDPGLDFLFGNSSTYAQGSGAQISAFALLNYFYGQDTWKVASNLTISYGLGYQIDTPLRSRQYGGEGVPCYIIGQQSTIFPTAPQGLNYPGDPGCTDATQAHTRYTDFGPRLGFAYTPDLGFLSAGNSKKLAIRGGFGIYYNRTEEESALQTLETPPFGGASGGATDFGGVPSFADPFTDINGGGSEKNKFPFVFATPGQKIDFTQYEQMFLDTYNKNFRSPYAENFQLTIERELPSHIVARVSYIGSLAHHNQTTTEGNPVTPAGHAACLAATTSCSSLSTSLYRDYHSYFFPNDLLSNYVDPTLHTNPYAAIGVVGSEGSSNYNSLQVGVEKGLSHGLQFQVSYTYSHSLDEASSFENSGFGGARGYNQFNTGLNYGDSQYDARQRLVLAPIYTVPSRKGEPFYSPYNLALGGWEITGIATFSTGFPFDISYGGSSSNSLWCGAGYSFYACPDEPNQIAPIVRTNPRARLAINAARTSWFDGTGFAPAPIGTFGNTHRDEYHGPGTNNTNMILAKNFPLGSDNIRRLQIRMESDNVFNHTNFSNPGSTVSTSQNCDANGNNCSTGLSTSGFGQISSAGSGRLTQLAAKIYF